MGYALIWVESLAASLLLVAVLLACTAGLARVLLPGLAALLLVAAAGALSFGLWELHSSGAVALWSFAYFASWAAALAVGLAVLLRLGWKRAGGAPAARDWPRGPLALALGVVAILACITFSNMDLATKVQLAAVRAEAGAKLLALLPPRPADRDNAAPVYHEAFDLLPDVDDLPTPLKEKAKAWLNPRANFDFQDKDLEAFLRGQQRCLALLRQAAAMPACSFHRDYFASADMLLPELHKLQRAAELLALDARARARRGDGAGALDDVVAVFGVARHANEPLLVSLAVSANLDRLGVRALEDVLAHAALKPADLAGFRVGEVSYHGAVQRNIQVEEAGLGLPFILSAVDASAGVDSQWLQGEVPRLARWVLDSPFYRVFFLPDDLAAYRREMKAYHDLAGRPYAQTREAWRPLYRSFRGDRGGILTALILPAMDRFLVLVAEADASHRLAALAVAVESYRAAKGKLPERLDELTPDILARLPADPFDGKPLRLRRDGKDVVLYSVGPNGADDGGNALDEKEQPGDIVFRLRGR